MTDFDSLVDDSQQQAQQPMQGQLPKFDDLQDDSQQPQSSSSQHLRFDDLQDDEQKKADKFNSPGQQLLAGAEGLAQGIGGPLATAAEFGLSKMGFDELKPENIAARQEANPRTHAVAEAVGLGLGLWSGVGEAALATKLAGRLAPEALSVTGKIASAALKGAIETGVIQGGDEISKAMLGQGDPNHPVASALAHTGAAALFGAGTGGLFNVFGQTGTAALRTLENNKLGTKAKQLLEGIGAAAQYGGDEAAIKQSMKDATKTIRDPFLKTTYEKALSSAEKEALYNNIKPGVDLYNKGLEKAVNKTVDFATEGTGMMSGGPQGWILSKMIEPLAEKIIGKPLIGLSKRAIPTITRVLSSGKTNGIYDALDYAKKVDKGYQSLNKSVNYIFKGGGQQLYNYNSRDRDRIEKYMDSDGLQQDMNDELNNQQTDQDGQSFAEGGTVQPEQPVRQESGVTTHFPDQSMLMTAAKSRVYNYLNSVKPRTKPALPFDKQHDDKRAKRRYNDALDIAARPLEITKHVKQGTLSVDHMKHFIGMYPEMHKMLSEKITKKIADAQMNNESLPYKTRQAVSLFLGAPLDSTYTPQSIMTAQSTFILKPNQGPQPTKKGTAKLGKNNKSYQTADQAAEARNQKD